MNLTKLVRKTLLPVGIAAVIFSGSCAEIREKREDSFAIPFEAMRLWDGTSAEGWKEIMKHLDYQDDGTIWKSARRTIEDGGGSCASIASLSAFYSGEKYGYNILCLFAYDETKRIKESGHAVHLLMDGDKYGSRGFFGDNILPVYSLEDVIRQLNESKEGRFNQYFIINLDEMNPEWRTTKENMYKDYVNLLMETRPRIRVIQGKEKEEK